MASTNATTNGIEATSDSTTGKRKRVDETQDIADLVNGHDTSKSAQGLDSLHNLLFDLVEVLQEYEIAKKVLNIQIQNATTEDRTPKRSKLASSSKSVTVSSKIQEKVYTTIDAFWTDLQAAISATRASSDGEGSAEAVIKLEEEIITLLTTEIEGSDVPIPRSEDHGALFLSSIKEEPTLATDKNLVLTIPGFQYNSSQGPKRLYSSFRTSSRSDRDQLPALALDRLPNNVTATSAKVSRVDRAPRKPQTLKDIVQQSKHTRLEPPRPRTSGPKGSTVTWVQQEEYKRPVSKKDKHNYYDQPLSTGQWLSYYNPPNPAEMPSAEARRKRRDRALSTGETNVELTQQEKAAIEQSRQIYERAKADSLFKSIYSSFAPTHDNSDAIIPKSVRSQYWWQKYGAARYFASSAPLESFPAEVEQQDDTIVDEAAVKDKQFGAMLDAWIDPELLSEMPKDKDDTEKEVEDILAEISEMLFTLSSYQRNRLSTLTNKQQGSSSQNKTLVELLGDPSTPSSSEQLLYETLRDSLAGLIETLPPHAVAKLNGKQMGELNISTKLLVEEPHMRGTMINPELQNLQTAQTAQVVNAKMQSGVPARISSTQQVSTPTPASSTNLARPQASVFSKHRPTAGSSTYQNYGTPQQQATPRVSYSQQTSSVTPAPLTNGIRPTVNGYPSYGSQGSPQRPASSASRPSGTPSAPQTYTNHNTSTAGRSASPQVAVSTSQAQRPNWNPSNGTIGSMFTPEEISRLEERQKAQMAAQAGQLRGEPGTPISASQAMSPASNGTPGK